MSKRTLPFKDQFVMKPVSGFVHQYSYNYRENLVIYYHIDKRLTLNVTFIKIDFNNIKWRETCSSNYSMLVVKALTNSYLEHRYCGYYSLFHFYPSFKNISINISVWYSAEYNVTFSFSIMDSNFIKSLQSLFYVKIIMAQRYKVEVFTLQTHLNLNALQF